MYERRKRGVIKQGGRLGASLYFDILHCYTTFLPYSRNPIDLIDVDVTELVKGMTGTNTNNGFFIRLQNEVIYNSRIFCSSFYPTEEKHPKLEVTYKN